MRARQARAYTVPCAYDANGAFEMSDATNGLRAGSNMVCNHSGLLQSVWPGTRVSPVSPPASIRIQLKPSKPNQQSRLYAAVLHGQWVQLHLPVVETQQHLGHLLTLNRGGCGTTNTAAIAIALVHGSRQIHVDKLLLVETQPS